MELIRPYQVLRDAGVKSTVSVFGSARISKSNPMHTNLSKWLDVAEEFAYEITDRLSKPTGYTEYCITTGAGPAIMKAANKGAMKAGGNSIGMSISLPFEATSNEYVDEEFDFCFKYFALRKFYMCKLSKVIAAFPGSVGTFDELYECITLQQTGKMPLTPIILFGQNEWSLLRQQLNSFKASGLASDDDFKQITYVDTVHDGIAAIETFYSNSNIGN